MAQTHIPAWRKLGLKLKYAKDTSNPSNDAGSITKSQTPHDLLQQQSHANSTAGTEQPDELNGRIRIQDLSVRSGATEEEEDARSKATERPAKRRKSVTFTPETKTQDGTSVGELLDAWKQVESNEKLGPSQSVPENTRNGLERTTSGARKKDKKAKKLTFNSLTPHEGVRISQETAKANDALNSSHPTSSTSQTLTYLDLFHNKKADWKFNKARQNQVFKQAFDLEKIPSTYDDALLSYVEGLQGTAARNHLRERAVKVCESDEREISKETASMNPESGATTENMQNQADQISSDEKRHLAAYQAALRRHKSMAKWDAILAEEDNLQMTRSWQLRLSKRARAERVLQRIGAKTEKATPSVTVNTAARKNTGVDFEVKRVVEQSIDQNGDTVGTKRKRRRKRRTTMPDEDSSEDESSSDDSDDDESSRGKSHKQPATKRTKVSNSREDETSSGSDDDTSPGSSGASSSDESDPSREGNDVDSTSSDSSSEDSD